MAQPELDATRYLQHGLHRQAPQDRAIALAAPRLAVPLRVQEAAADREGAAALAASRLAAPLRDQG